ncbi:MAG: hypothetical protein M0Z56_06795 [Desulfobacteraceae bacterium]|nr:hypothetical protein [Desulfobacteraceae bacterium]
MKQNKLLGESPTSEEIEMIRRFGRGTLFIEDFALGPEKNG